MKNKNVKLQSHLFTWLFKSVIVLEIINGIFFNKENQVTKLLGYLTYYDEIAFEIMKIMWKRGINYVETWKYVWHYEFLLLA